MGSQNSYLTVSGKSKELIWSLLGLVQSTSPLIPGSRQDRFVGGFCQQDLYLVVSVSPNLVEDEPTLSALSENATVFFGQVYEGVNFSITGEWRNGEKRWTVEHGQLLATEELTISGEPPAILQDIIATIDAKKKDTPEDAHYDFYFSVPVLLFKSLTGYSYERSPNFIDDGEAVVLFRPARGA